MTAIYQPDSPAFSGKKTEHLGIIEAMMCYRQQWAFEDETKTPSHGQPQVLTGECPEPAS